MSYDRDAALDQLAEWESDIEMEKYYADEYDKWNDACHSQYGKGEFNDWQRVYDACHFQEEWQHELKQYYESCIQNRYVDLRCCSIDIEMEQYYHQECKKIIDSWVPNNENKGALKSPNSIIDEFYKKKSAESSYDNDNEVKSVTSAEAEEEFIQSFRQKHPGCEDEYKKWLELTHDDDGQEKYLESIAAIGNSNALCNKTLRVAELESRLVSRDGKAVSVTNDRQNEERKKKGNVDSERGSGNFNVLDISRCCSSNIEMEQYYQQECEKIRDTWLSNNVGDDVLKTPYTIVDEYYKNKCVEKKQNNNGQNNKCTMCGITGHYTRDCESDENFKQEVLDGCWTFWYCDCCGSEFLEESEHILHIEGGSCHK